MAFRPLASSWSASSGSTHISVLAYAGRNLGKQLGHEPPRAVNSNRLVDLDPSSLMARRPARPAMVRSECRVEREAAHRGLRHEHGNRAASRNKGMQQTGSCSNFAPPAANNANVAELIEDEYSLIGARYAPRSTLLDRHWTEGKSPATVESPALGMERSGIRTQCEAGSHVAHRAEAPAAGKPAVGLIEAEKNAGLPHLVLAHFGGSRDVAGALVSRKDPTAQNIKILLRHRMTTLLGRHRRAESARARHRSNLLPPRQVEQAISFVSPGTVAPHKAENSLPPAPARHRPGIGNRRNGQRFSLVDEERIDVRCGILAANADPGKGIEPPGDSGSSKRRPPADTHASTSQSCHGHVASKVRA